VYVRFVVPTVDRWSGVRLGIIQAAYRLRYADVLAPHDDERLAATLDWFNKNLGVPTYYRGNRHPRAKALAICWFKPHAKAQIERARDLQFLLEYYGSFAEMITCRRPGYVVYEDAHQIAACPFKSTAA
jgi:hypothetical protein